MVLLTLSLPCLELGGGSGRWRQTTGGTLLLAMPSGLEVGVLAKVGNERHDIGSVFGRGRGRSHRRRTTSTATDKRQRGHHHGVGHSHVLLLDDGCSLILGCLPRDGGGDDFIVGRLAGGLERRPFDGGRFRIMNVVVVLLAHTIEIALGLLRAIFHLALLGPRAVPLAGTLTLDGLVAPGEAANTLRRLALTDAHRLRRHRSTGSPCLDGFHSRGGSLFIVGWWCWKKEGGGERYRKTARVRETSTTAQQALQISIANERNPNKYAGREDTAPMDTIAAMGDLPSDIVYRQVVIDQLCV